MKKIVITLLAVTVLAAATIAVVVYLGVVNVAADEPHSSPVTALLETARNRSIVARADSIDVPQLDDPAKVQAGAGNYAAMCVSCHLAPGLAATELSEGLYPAPPNLTQAGLPDDPARTFWVIKHGIKASGMPAWGKSMDDRYIWDIVAFLERLPSLDAQQYQAMVNASGGHQHGGGETDHQGGSHHDSVPEAHHEGGRHSEPDAGPSDNTSTTHVHADGKEHIHEH